MELGQPSISKSTRLQELELPPWSEQQRFWGLTFRGEDCCSACRRKGKQHRSGHHLSGKGGHGTHCRIVEPIDEAERLATSAQPFSQQVRLYAETDHCCKEGRRVEAGIGFGDGVGRRLWPATRRGESAGAETPSNDHQPDQQPLPYKRPTLALILQSCPKPRPRQHPHPRYPFGRPPSASQFPRRPPFLLQLPSQRRPSQPTRSLRQKQPRPSSCPTTH